MATINRLSFSLNVTFPFTENDIQGDDTDNGGTSNHWVSMVGYETFMCLVELGTFNATDSVDTLKLQQATSSAGAGAKNLINPGAQSTLGSDGDTAKLEVHVSDMDVEGGFTHVRVLVGEASGTGADNVSAVYIRGNPMHAKANLTSTTTSHVPT